MEGEYLWVTAGSDLYAFRRQTRWGFFLHGYLYPTLCPVFLACLLVLVLWAIPRCINIVRPQGATVLAKTSLPIKAPRRLLGARQEEAAELAQASSSGGTIGSFSLPSGIDSCLTWTMVKRLNWSWPMLVQAAKEEDVPPWCLAFLHYQEPTPHFADYNPKNGEGIFQLHDYNVAYKIATGNYKKNLYPYTGKKVTNEEFLAQARRAARFLQKKAKITTGRLRFDMPPFDSRVIEAMYAYNGRTYAGYNPPSVGLKNRLRELRIPEDKKFVRSPYIIGRMTESEKIMFLRTRGTVVIEFYGYIPLVAKLQQLYQK